jgi:hypothetical protein
MIDSRLRLSVFQDNDGTFLDFTEEACEYGRNPMAVEVSEAEEPTPTVLYLGYRKPFLAVYCEMSTPSTSGGTCVIEYWNGTEWTAPENARDTTKQYTESGWLAWDRPDDWEETEVNDVSKFWVRVTSEAGSVPMPQFDGINIVFSDDFDLKTEFPNVADVGFLPTGAPSNILMHVAARNQIIQDLRSRGFIKVDADGNWQNLTPWDLHDIEEVKQASTLLTLAKIFFNYSDDPNDHWMTKAKSYEAKYEKIRDLLAPSIDSDDDGVVDTTERRVMTVSRMYR